MINATIIFVRKNGRPSTDDKITVSRMDSENDLFKVTFSTPDYTYRKQFITDARKACRYIEDTLTSMRHDTDPFEYVQVHTNIHPAVLYHVADLDSCDVRHLIMDIIYDALKFNVTNVE